MFTAGLPVCDFHPSLAQKAWQKAGEEMDFFKTHRKSGEMWWALETEVPQVNVFLFSPTTSTG